MCHPYKLENFNYPRVPYFTSVESFTKIYKFNTGLGGSYGHKCKNVAVTEFFRFNGILVKDGVLGGKEEAANILRHHYILLPRRKIRFC